MNRPEKTLMLAFQEKLAQVSCLLSENKIVSVLSIMLLCDDAVDNETCNLEITFDCNKTGRREQLIKYVQAINVH